MRGYALIGLHNPKNGVNVGSAMRAVGVYKAAGLVVDGARRNKLARHPTDTMSAWKHIPLQWVDDLFDVIPFGCAPVAVDLVEGAKPLDAFRHPERAIYIFGAEDATLGAKTIKRCAHTVFIPTHGCMNLAATVNVVLYDRLAKSRAREVSR